MAKNKVIKGLYEGFTVATDGVDGIRLANLGMGTYEEHSVTKTTIRDFTVLDASVHKSAAGAVGLAAVGAFALGPVGLAAGLAAKNKGEYLVQLTWNDGSTSLLDINDKFYKKLIIILA